MLNLYLTPKALDDLEKIFEYTVQTWGINQAHIYQDTLFHGMSQICNEPKIGSEYQFAKGEYRKLNIGKHLLFYKHDKAKCVITRVLHERMDYDSHLL